MIVRADWLAADDSPAGVRQSLQKRAAHRVGIGLLGHGVSAHFEREASAALLANRYRAMPSAQGLLQMHVASDERGLTHFFHQEQAYVWPYGAIGDRATAFLADAIVTGALLRAIPASLTLHAAALEYGGAAFAITGISTAGKTTTAIACVAAGCSIYSDERCIITAAGVVPYPRAINVRAGSLDLLRSSLPDGPVTRRLRRFCGSEWNDASMPEVFGSRERPEAAPLRALFSIRGRGDTPRSRRISPVDMLADARVGAVTREDGLDSVRVLLETLSGIACYELVLGSPFATALHVQRVVERASG